MGDCPHKGAEHLDKLAETAQQMNERAIAEGSTPDDVHLLGEDGVRSLVKLVREHYEADPTSDDFQFGMFVAAHLIQTAPVPGFLLDMFVSAIFDAIGVLRLASATAKTNAVFDDIVARLDAEAKEPPPPPPPAP